MSDEIPSQYNLPEPLQETIRRTWQEKTEKNLNFAWQMGFHGTNVGGSLSEVVERLDKSGHLQVIKEVYDRCHVLPNLWKSIRAITVIWDYKAGHEISQGFNFTCDDPNGLLSLVKASSSFCQDRMNCHGPRDTFRELIKGGAGLHACVVQPASRNSHEHDLHIDKYQTVCTKQSDGYCDYKYLDKNFYNHMKDVTPWWVGERLKELGEIVEKYPPPKGPKF